MLYRWGMGCTEESTKYEVRSTKYKVRSTRCRLCAHLPSDELLQILHGAGVVAAAEAPDDFFAQRQVIGGTGEGDERGNPVSIGAPQQSRHAPAPHVRIAILGDDRRHLSRVRRERRV